MIGPSARDHARHSADARLLKHMARELRERTPQARGDDPRALEALLARIDADAAPPVAVHSRVVRYAVPAVLAAAAAVGLSISRRATTAVAPTSTTANEVASSGASPVRFIAHSDPVAGSRAGFASWLIEPGGAVTLLEDGERMVIALDEGAVQIDVTPQPIAERFVVVAGGARVAVHGTHFRVARHADHVEVDVMQGVVSVENVTEGSTHPARWLLPAPAGGSFRLDDVRDGRLRPLEPFDTSAVAAAQSPLVEHRALREKSTSKGPASPARAPNVEATRDQLERLAMACFGRSARPASDVLLSVSTTLVVDFAPDGRLTSSSFDPPLAPAIEECFRRESAGVRGPAGSLDVPMQLAAP